MSGFLLIWNAICYIETNDVNYATAYLYVVSGYLLIGVSGWGEIRESFKEIKQILSEV